MQPNPHNLCFTKINLKTKPKNSRRKELIKISEEINEIEIKTTRKKTQQKDQ